ncbi:hypothetical protein [Burkholderia cepacia]|nr:hypothetical protein [Burkholderia cepacia]
MRPAGYRASSATLLHQLETDIARIRAGKLSHHLGLDGLEAERLRTRMP